MTAITQAHAAANGHGTFPKTRVGAPLPQRQKRPGYVALAIALIVGLAALGAYWNSQAGHKVPVVEVIRDVPAGHVLSRADVSTVDVAGQVTAIGGSRIDTVVGQVAAVELLPNTLLQRAMLSTGDPLLPTSARVGVELKPGQLPSEGLSDGVTVQVLQLPNRNGVATSASTSTADAQSAIVLVSQATVFSSSSDPSQSGGTLMTLVVPKASAAAVATASSAGLVALVQVGR